MSSRCYRFQGFELDALARELRSGDDAVALPLKSFECLVYLLEHRERAVGRDELISAVWGRVDVSDALLGQTLARARRAVGDTGDEQRVIRTVPRFGYHWVAPVAEVGEESVLPVDASGPQATAGAAAARPDGGPEPGAEAPQSARLARRHTLAAAIGGALVLAVLAGAFGLRALDRPSAGTAARSGIAAPAANAAGTAMVLPVEVADATPDSRWIRLGAMDYLASRLRERGALPVLPSDQTIAFVARHDEAVLGDPARRWPLVQAAGVVRILAPRAERTGGGWHVRLEVQDAERRDHYDGTAATPLAAADLALGAWLDTLGIGGTLAPASHPTLLELQQRIDTAFLEGDVAAATELVESAPPGLQRDPSIAVRAAEIDERAGRSELARKQFARIAHGGEGVTPSLRGRALYGLCAIGFRRNELEVAARHCDEALDALAGQSDAIARGRAYMMRAVIDDHLGHFDAALAGFGRARIEWRRAGNAPGEASVDANEGLALAHNGRHAEAIAAFDRAAAVFERFGVRDHLASSLAAKSDAQRLALDLVAARESSARAWQLASGIESTQVVRSIGYSRALALLAGGRLDEAAHVIGRFDAAAPSAPPEFAVLHSALLAARGRYEEALARAPAILDRVLAPPDPTSDATLSQASSVFIDAALGAGDLARGDAFLARLRDAGPSVQDPDRAFVADLAAARLASARGEAAGATRHFDAALQFALAANCPAQVAEAASAWVLDLLARDQVEEATRIAGHLTRYADRDWQAARAMLALYQRLGDTRSAERTRAALPGLAGQRHAPGDRRGSHERR
jgi:DNA-binding winged helix-turn-helix (wHTH) protein/tetratricopeptide (TPR) repeat protein